MRWKRTLEKRRTFTGWMFVLPWIVGVIPFFIIPLISTLYYSLGELKLAAGGIDVTFLGGENYLALFTKDPTFVKELVGSLKTMLTESFMILVFGLFFALLLNQKFHGRTVARAILFLPVIVTSGVVIFILKNDSTASSLMSGGGSQGFIQLTAVSQLLSRIGLGQEFVDTVTGLMSSIFDLLWKCGVQTLLFLSGLQSVPSSFYEAASVEGASSWEKFWKITFPSIAPILLIGIVYTIVDSFTYYGNNIMLRAISPALDNLRYSYAAAMSLTYSAMVMAVLGLVFLLVGRRIIYTER